MSNPNRADRALEQIANALEQIAVELGALRSVVADCEATARKLAAPALSPERVAQSVLRYTLSRAARGSSSLTGLKYEGKEDADRE